MSTLIPVDASCISATFVKAQTSIVINVNVPLSKKPPAFSNAQLVDISKKTNYLTYQLVGTPLPASKSAQADLNVSLTKPIQINQATGGLPALSQITVIVGSTSSSSGISINVPLTVMPVPISGDFSSTTVASSDPSTQIMASAYFTKGKTEIVVNVKAQSSWALQNPQIVLDQDMQWSAFGYAAFVLAGTIPLDGSQVLASAPTIQFTGTIQKWASIVNGVPVGGVSGRTKPINTIDLVACTDAQPDGGLFLTIPLTIRKDVNDAIPPLTLVPRPAPFRPS